MSTTCNVMVVLKEKDLNTKIYNTKTGNFVDTLKLYPIMGIYIQHDGYLDGVGEYLRTKLTDYDKVVSYIVEGHRTSDDKSYVDCGEKWERNQPKFVQEDWIDNLTNDSLPNGYVYLFKDNQWWYRCSSSKSNNWLPL